MLEKMKKPPNLRSTCVRGFTLIELMVTIVVLAILAALAAPTFNDMRDRARVRAAAEAIYSHVQFARSETLKQSRNLFVRVSAGATWCVGISNATACDCGTANSCTFGPAGALVEHNLRAAEYPGVTIATTQADVEIDSRRAGTAAATQITVTGAGTYEARVVMSKLGKTAICGNVGGYPAC